MPFCRCPVHPKILPPKLSAWAGCLWHELSCTLTLEVLCFDDEGGCVRHPPGWCRGWHHPWWPPVVDNSDSNDCFFCRYNCKGHCGAKPPKRVPWGATLCWWLCNWLLYYILIYYKLLCVDDYYIVSLVYWGVWSTGNPVLNQPARPRYTCRIETSSWGFHEKTEHIACSYIRNYTYITLH
jgi:hypothetical protein